MKPTQVSTGNTLAPGRPLAATLLVAGLLATGSAAADDSQLEMLSEALPTVIDMMNQRKQILRRQGVAITDYGDEAQAQTAPSAQGRRTDALPIARGHEAGYRDGQRNPFGITDTLYREQRVLQSDGEGAGVYQRSEFIATLPKLKLRGVINKQRDPEPIALLDIDNDGVHMVRVGDRISFNPADPKQVIRIKQIERLSVIVEVGTLGDLIVVR